jgi:hypothetical protein
MDRAVLWDSAELYREAEVAKGFPGGAVQWLGIDLASKPGDRRALRYSNRPG